MRISPDMIKNLLSSLSSKNIELFTQMLLLCNEDQKPDIVKVTEEEKRKADALLEVFQDYIDEHSFFDIVYSKKFGYYRLDTDGEFDQFSSADELMNSIINEFSHDVQALKLGGEHMDSSMRPAEEAELRKRISPYIEKLDNKSHYYEILEAYVGECGEPQPLSLQEPDAPEVLPEPLTLIESEEMISEEFWDEFFNEVSDVALHHQRRTPEHQEFKEKSFAWNSTLAELGQFFVSKYDEIVGGAFSDYETILGEYFWTRGLLDAAHNTIRNPKTEINYADIPGFENAARQLEQTYTQFLNDLPESHRAQGREYLSEWRKLKNTSMKYYYFHAVQFLQRLLERVHIQNI